jgi:adenylate cyclase
MASRLGRLRTLLILGVGVFLTGLGIAAYATDALDDLELDTVDTRFEIRGEDPPPKDLVVVKIDDVTFDELELRWPFSRTVHADVIDKVMADKPKAIGYDVQFSEPSERLNPDLALAEAVADAKGRVVLATTEVNERGEGKFLGGPQEVLEKDLGGRFGNGLFPNDSGVIRRMEFSIAGMETLAVATVEAGSRRQVKPGEAGSEEGAWIDYHGPPDTIESVSFSRVVRGRTPKGFFRDKYVLIGPTAPSLQDVHPTSISGDEMPGAEIQANAIDTVRRGFPLTNAPGGLDLALIVLLGLAAPVASLRFSPLRALALALGAGALFTIGAQLAFNSGTVLSFVYPVGTLLAVSVAVLALHYLTVAFERERVRDLFSRFVPEDVVDEVIDSAEGGLRLGGVQREGTVMFSDLRGFTSFAEKMPVDQVIQVLNRYLTEMSDAILDHRGTLVAYMGDGIMAVFGAPVEQSDHADRALAAAREMLGPRLERFNEYLREQGLSEGFRMGVGLNSGQVMSGNVGSERRLEYTAIGDTTNTAARLEGMTKGTPHMLFASQSTVDLLKRRPDDLVFVDEFEVRGREAKIQLWSLADPSASVSDSGAGASASPA